MSHGRFALRVSRSMMRNSGNKCFCTSDGLLFLELTRDMTYHWSPPSSPSTAEPTAGDGVESRTASPRMPLLVLRRERCCDVLCEMNDCWS
jgi:hypothetical protein